MGGIVATDYDMKALLDQMALGIFQTLNCVKVGIIQSFDSSAQTVTAKIAFKQIVNGTLAEYPLLIDCPAVIMGGGDARLELPISAGDECLLLFSDNDIDAWFNSGQVGPLSTQRLHNFSDGFALVGVRSTLKKISSFDLTRASLINGQTSVGVSSSKVRIKNANRTLKDVIEGTVDKIGGLQSALTTFATGLTPVTLPAKATALAAAIALLDTALTTFKTTVVEDLLE